LGEGRRSTATRTIASAKSCGGTKRICRAKAVCANRRGSALERENRIDHARGGAQQADRHDAARGSQHRVFDFLYLAELSTSDASSHRACAAMTRVFAAQAVMLSRGRACTTLGFKSLYPSLIRTFNIDPLALAVDAPVDADLIDTAGGARFRRELAILPQLLDDLFPRREAAKRNGDAIASHAIKILMNSFYGVLGTPACRLTRSRERDHRSGQTFPAVVEGLVRKRVTQCSMATPTACSQTHTVDADAAEQKAKLVVRLNRDVQQYIVERWRVKSQIRTRAEKLYVKLSWHRCAMVPAAAQRYAGVIHAPIRRTSNSSEWKWCVATGPNSRTGAASCMRGCSTDSPSIIPHRCGQSGATRRAGSRARYRKGLRKASANTPRAHRRTLPRRANRRAAGPTDRIRDDHGGARSRQSETPA
jgi:hypothetical protein